MKKNLLRLLIAATILSSCGSPETAENSAPETTEATEANTKTLKSLLDRKKNKWAEKATAEQKRIYAEGIKSIENSGILKTAMQVGDVAPDFEWVNAAGETVRLTDYMKKGPVILTWYRGGWCPYCNITLHKMQKELLNFKAAGATLIALSPELPEKSLATKEKHELDFELMSDAGNGIARAYGVVFKLTPELAASYQKSFDLHNYNGDESNELPLAATYIIAQDGVIAYAFLDADYRNRAEPADILHALNDLKR